MAFIHNCHFFHSYRVNILHVFYGYRKEKMTVIEGTEWREIWGSWLPCALVHGTAVTEHPELSRLWITTLHAAKFKVRVPPYLFGV